MARLQEIFVYSFAPTEVYFNARWYYRVNDCHEYAQMAGASDDYRVQWEGDELSARSDELFFSLHMDENHADCILRACTVHVLNTPDEPPSGCWDAIRDERHEFLAWRAYDDKKVHGLTALRNKKLKEACELEVKRGPQALIRLAKSAGKPKPMVVAEPAGPLEDEELTPRRRDLHRGRRGACGGESGGGAGCSGRRPCRGQEHCRGADGGGAA